MNKPLQYIIYLCTFIFAFLLWFYVTMPNANKITSCIKTRMYGLELCEKSAQYVKLKNISPLLQQLIIVSEDVSFYSHQGFDVDELTKSLKQNLVQMRLARGGSTITQQLAKNVFLTFEKSFFRKLREAVLAYQIEMILPKDKILEKYLNIIEFGPKIYGVKQAAHHYFSKSPSELNLLESAFLTYLIPNPKTYSQVYNKASLTRYARYRILDLCYKMYRYGRISSTEYETAKLYVDNFPWKHINFSEQLSISDAHPASPDSQSESEKNGVPPDLPETDQSLEAVAPPEEVDEYESNDSSDQNAQDFNTDEEN